VLEWPLALADQWSLVGAAPSLSGPSIRDIGRSVARYFTGQRVESRQGLAFELSRWPSGRSLHPHGTGCANRHGRAATGDSSTSALAFNIARVHVMFSLMQWAIGTLTCCGHPDLILASCEG
jgi:hypothetical protein